MHGGPIVIVGGGPAGATTAALLARQGRAVLLIERRTEAQTKCCGCCLAPRARGVLTQLGLWHVVESAASGTTSTWRLWDSHGRALLSESLGEQPGLVVERHRLDAALTAEAERAGATVIRGSTAVLEPDGQVVVRRIAANMGDARGRAPSAVTMRLRPSLVIGADGVGSGIARSAQLVAAERSRRFAFACRFDGVPPESCGVRSKTIEIHVLPEGYLGLVGHAGGVLAAALVDRTRARAGGGAAPGQVIEQALGRSIALAALRDSNAVGFVATGPLPWRPQSIVGMIAGGEGRMTGVALVGDAAGYEEPFTGEGMAWSFESAALLVEALREGTEWNGRMAARYTALHSESFRTRCLRLRFVAGVGVALGRSRWLAECARAIRTLPGSSALTGAIVRRVVAA